MPERQKVMLAADPRDSVFELRVDDVDRVAAVLTGGVVVMRCEDLAEF